jgi:hypothetical protein
MNNNEVAEPGLPTEPVIPDNSAITLLDNSIIGDAEFWSQDGLFKFLLDSNGRINAVERGSGTYTRKDGNSNVFTDGNESFAYNSYSEYISGLELEYSDFGVETNLNTNERNFYRGGSYLGGDIDITQMDYGDSIEFTGKSMVRLSKYDKNDQLDKADFYSNVDTSMYMKYDGYYTINMNVLDGMQISGHNYGDGQASVGVADGSEKIISTSNGYNRVGYYLASDGIEAVGCVTATGAPNSDGYYWKVDGAYGMKEQESQSLP